MLESQFRRVKPRGWVRPRAVRAWSRLIGAERVVSAIALACVMFSPAATYGQSAPRFPEPGTGQARQPDGRDLERPMLAQIFEALAPRAEQTTRSRPQLAALESIYFDEFMSNLRQVVEGGLYERDQIIQRPRHKNFLDRFSGTAPVTHGTIQQLALMASWRNREIANKGNGDLSADFNRITENIIDVLDVGNAELGALLRNQGNANAPSAPLVARARRAATAALPETADQVPVRPAQPGSSEPIGLILNSDAAQIVRMLLLVEGPDTRRVAQITQRVAVQYPYCEPEVAVAAAQVSRDWNAPEIARSVYEVMVKKDKRWARKMVAGVMLVQPGQARAVTRELAALDPGKSDMLMMMLDYAERSEWSRLQSIYTSPPFCEQRESDYDEPPRDFTIPPLFEVLSTTEIPIFFRVSPR